MFKDRRRETRRSRRREVGCGSKKKTENFSESHLHTFAKDSEISRLRIATRYEKLNIFGVKQCKSVSNV